MERSQEYFAALITVFRTTFASIYQSFAMPKGSLCVICIKKSVLKKIKDKINRLIFKNLCIIVVQDNLKKYLLQDT